MILSCWQIHFFVESPHACAWYMIGNPDETLWNRWMVWIRMATHLWAFLFQLVQIDISRNRRIDHPELRTVLFAVPRRFRCGECSKPWQLSYSTWLRGKVTKLANQIHDFQGLSDFDDFMRTGGLTMVLIFNQSQYVDAGSESRQVEQKSSLMHE